jgi:putative membrane protein
MLLIAHIACAIVIALHIYFIILEMFLWKTKGPRIFGISREFAAQSAALASNQGLYNGFLVAALLMGYFSPPFMFYGLGCVIVAGIWGAITVNKRIFFVQALPALIALLLYYIGQ